MPQFLKLRSALILLAILLVVGASGYLAYRLYEENRSLRTAVSELEGTLQTSEQNIAELTQNTESLSDALSAERTKANFLQEQATSFAAAVQNLTGRVTTLDKLTKIDPELLIKYSKVYFLNEHYTPEALAKVPPSLVRDGKEEYFNARAYRYLERLTSDAKAAGTELRIVSAYRSFDTQKDLKSQYRVTYGVGANRFSAEQGYSEHQLGTTVDSTTPELGAAFSRFDSTPAFAWLRDNAHRYGFILSYPKGNAYYIYEPWHWRFVGVELATKLKTEGKNFYDMDQRAIDEFLVKIFD